MCEAISAMERPLPEGGEACQTASSILPRSNWLARSLVAKASTMDLLKSMDGALAPGAVMDFMSGYLGKVTVYDIPAIGVKRGRDQSFWTTPVTPAMKRVARIQPRSTCMRRKRKRRREEVRGAGSGCQ